MIIVDYDAGTNIASDRYLGFMIYYGTVTMMGGLRSGTHAIALVFLWHSIVLSLNKSDLVSHIGCEVVRFE